MINMWIDTTSKLLALKNLDKLPRWVVVGGVVFSAAWLIAQARRDQLADQALEAQNGEAWNDWQ